jgi:hypothetical protein
MAKRFFRFDEKCLSVPSTAQRVGADDADLVRAHVAQPLTEPPQAREGALLARRVERALFVETRCQAHHFAQAIHDRRLAMLIAGDDHMKAVGAQIDRGHNLGRVAGTRLRVG